MNHNGAGEGGGGELMVINPQPVMDLAETKKRYEAVKVFAREIMRKGVDYGVIPGTGDKPVLLKPGAEKLCSFFGLRSRFTCEDRLEEWERGMFHYRYKCQLIYLGQAIAEGEGSCNSKEKKYRWLSRYDSTITDEERGRIVKREVRRSRDGQPYTVYQLENDDPYSLVNTIVKMAQKRALIAATLIAVSASEFFSYELDDDELELAAAGAADGPGDGRGGAKAGGSGPAGGGGATAATVTVTIKSVGEKKGGSGNKTWTLFKIAASDGQTYSTFDTADADAARAALARKCQVELSYTVDAKNYRNVIKGGVRPLEGGAAAAATAGGESKAAAASGAAAAGAAAADQVVIVCAHTPPEAWRKEMSGAGFVCSKDGLTWTARENEIAAACAMAAGSEPWFKEHYTVGGA